MSKIKEFIKNIKFELSLISPADIIIPAISGLIGAGIGLFIAHLAGML